MPLTPEANLHAVRRGARMQSGRWDDALDKLLSLDISHAVHAGDTITLRAPSLASESQLSKPYRPTLPLASVGCDAVPSPPRQATCPTAKPPPPLPKILSHVPDGQNATGLSKVGLILNTADPLFENGRDLGWRCLCVGVCADGGDSGCGISLQRVGLALARDPRGAKTRAKFDQRPTSSRRRRSGAATAAKAQLSFAGGAGGY